MPTLSGSTSLRRALPIALPLLGALAALTPTPDADPARAGISWSDARLATALSTAAGQNSIVMVAINMPGERASDAIRDEHYKDSHLGKLSQSSINLLIEVGPEGSANLDEPIVRERYLKVANDALVAVPHHIFIDPREEGGKVISSVPWLLTEGQLEWAWVDAIRQLQPDFEWELSDKARAPEELERDGANGAGAPDLTPPTDEEVEHALAELKKGGMGRRGGGWGQMIQHYNVIIRSDSKAALKFAETSMRSFVGRNRFSERILRVIGDFSPPAWHAVVSPFLEDREAGNREEAARALEQLGEGKATSKLTKAYRTEKEDPVRGRLLRAMAKVGPADKGVIKTLERVISKDRVEAVRVQATAAASCIEDPDAAEKLLRKALSDESGAVRAAAAYAIASRRDESLLPMLEEAASAEKDTEAKGWLDTGVEIVKSKGELEPFDSFVEGVLGDRKKREPLDANAMRGGRGGDDGGEGNGRNGDEEGEDPGNGRGTGNGRGGNGRGRAGGGRTGRGSTGRGNTGRGNTGRGN